MNYPRLAVCAMAAIHVLLFFVLLWRWERLDAWPWIEYGRLAVFSCQGCLLGLWAALGGKGTPWRVVAVIATAAAWDWYVGLPERTLVTRATSTLIGQMFLVMGVLLLARLAGLRLGKVEHDGNDRASRFQFSIGQTLSWTTAMAVFMSGIHYLKNSLTIYFDEWRGSISVARLAVGLATIWLVCGGFFDASNAGYSDWLACGALLHIAVCHCNRE